MEQLRHLLQLDDGPEKILDMRLPRNSSPRRLPTSFRLDGLRRAVAGLQRGVFPLPGMVFRLLPASWRQPPSVSQDHLYTGGWLLSTRVYDIDNVWWTASA